MHAIKLLLYLLLVCLCVLYLYFSIYQCTPLKNSFHFQYWSIRYYCWLFLIHKLLLHLLLVYLCNISILTGYFREFTCWLSAITNLQNDKVLYAAWMHRLKYSCQTRMFGKWTYVSGSSNINDMHIITCQLRWVWLTPAGWCYHFCALYTYCNLQYVYRAHVCVAQKCFILILKANSNLAGKVLQSYNCSFALTMLQCVSSTTILSE